MEAYNPVEDFLSSVRAYRHDHPMVRYTDENFVGFSAATDKPDCACLIGYGILAKRPDLDPQEYTQLVLAHKDEHYQLLADLYPGLKDYTIAVDKKVFSPYGYHIMVTNRAGLANTFGDILNALNVRTNLTADEALDYVENHATRKEVATVE
jgi:hypothetical protein